MKRRLKAYKLIYESRVIDVSDKIKIQIEQERVVAEDDLQRLRDEFDAISKSVEEKYYKNNYAIESTQNRNFVDLLKIYADALPQIRKRGELR